MESDLPFTVALLSHSPHVAGAERMLLNLALLLRSVPGIDPILFIPGMGELAKEARDNNLRYDLTPQYPLYVYDGQADHGYRERANTARASLHDLLAGTKPEVILVNTLTSVIPGLVAAELELPFILWVHGVLDSFMIPNGDARQRLLHDRLLLELAHLVVCPSQWTARWLQGLIAGDRVLVIPNWTQVDTANAFASRGRPNNAFVCPNTFDHHKGHTTLLLAAAMLIDDGFDFEVNLFGEGTHKEEMVKMASKLGLSEIVHFQARTTDTTSMYDRSFCVVNPSLIEPFGMTLIEGMARRLPVIACKAGGPEEIVVDGETGFLVNPGDASAFAERMAWMLDNRSEAQVIGEKGYDRAMRRYSEKAALRGIPGILSNAVSNFEGYSRSSKLLGEMYDLYLSVGDPMQMIAWRSREGMTKSPLEAPHAVPPPRGYARVKGSITYRLRPEANNWSGIDVLASVLRGPADGMLELLLFTETGILLRESAFDLEGASGDVWLRFEFPPISNSMSNEFRLFFRKTGHTNRYVIVIREENALEALHRRIVRRLGVALPGNQIYCNLRYKAKAEGRPGLSAEELP